MNKFIWKDATTPGTWIYEQEFEEEVGGEFGS